MFTTRIRQATVAFLILCGVPLLSAQVIRPGHPGNPSPTQCQMDPQISDGERVPSCPSKITWYQSPMPAASACAAVFATPATGNGTSLVGDADPYANKRLFAAMSMPTASPSTPPSGNTYQPYACDFDRSTGTWIAAGELNGGTSVCYGANNHAEPAVINLGGGYVGIYACGPESGAPVGATNNSWGDSNGRGSGINFSAVPIGIGNCIGTTDCTNFGTGAMDITTSGHMYYLPASGQSEGSGGYYNGIALICGQFNGANNTGFGGLQVGGEGCLTIRKASTAGQFVIDTACTVGGTVTPFNFTTTAIGNNACGAQWQFGMNVHSDWFASIDLTGNTSTSTSLSITFPANGLWTQKVCTFTTSAGVASADIVNLANAINGNTLGGSGCNSVATYFHAYPMTADCARIAGSLGIFCKVSGTLSGALSAGSNVAVTLAATPAAAPVVGDKANFDNWNSGVQETATVTAVTDSTHFTVGSLANAHSSGRPVTIVNGLMLTAKNANPPTMNTAAMSGCASCTTAGGGTGGFKDLRAINSGVTSHFSYGTFRGMYNTKGTYFFCGLMDVQEGDSYQYAPANGYASWFAARCSRGPDFTHTGALGTYGVWDWGDASIINPSGDDGLINSISPAWEQSYTLGTTPTAGKVGFLGSPWITCTNAANSPCQGYMDASGSTSNVIGVVQPCTGAACTPPTGWVNFQTNSDQGTQGANAANSANNTGWPIASNYDLAIDNNNNLGIVYVCQDAAKNATEICYVTQSSSTLQTTNAVFVDDTVTNTATYEPNVALVRTPLGHMVILVATQEGGIYGGCTSHNPCLVQYVSTNNGTSWTKTVLTPPSWVGTTPSAQLSCSVNGDPKGWHIYALCYSPPNFTQYYTYDLYTGTL